MPEISASDHQSLVQRILETLPGIRAIYAYGSRVRGEPHPGSDLDLALLLPEGGTVSPVVLAQLQGDLEALAGYSIDLSILCPQMQLVHCKEVVAYGARVYVSDPEAVAGFEMRVLSAYARFCEDRRPIVEAYQSERNG